MTSPVVRYLILKDFRLHRLEIILSIACGVAALGLVQMKGEVPTVIGGVWFFIALIVLGSMLPSSNVINERKKQNLPFLMSLPISSMQYTLAKVASTFGMFLLPWLLLVAAVLSLIASRSDLPNGIIPMTLVLAGFTLVGFCVIAAVAIVSESEGCYIASTIACNSTYGIGWYLISRVPAISKDMASPVAVWSPVMLSILGAELGVMALSLGLTFYLQSRKRDFV
jgi:ABC-2 type transport system permease protein